MASEYDRLFESDGHHKDFTITFDDGTVITNTEIYQECFELTESLCSEPQLKIGQCEASQCKFTMAYINKSFKGRTFTVKITIDYINDFILGTYKVYDDVPTADRTKRNITAYDSMKTIIDADVTDWYNTLLPNENSTVTIKQMRDSLLAHLGITQEVTTLVNDNKVVGKTINNKRISGSEIMSAICEANGCFGHINRSNVFTYVYLSSPSDPIHPSLTLFPSTTLHPKPPTKPTEIGIQYRYRYPLPDIHYPDNELYPDDEIYPEWYEYDTPITGVYQYVDYEDFVCKQITGVQVKNDQNMIVAGVGRDNFYCIANNFLFFGKTSTECSEMAEGVLSKIRNVYYRPAQITAQGNPNIAVGTPIVLHTKYDTIESIILSRTLRGIQAMKDTYYADGNEEIEENLNGADNQMNQVRGDVATVKADLVEAQKIIAEEIQADRARISTIEANYINVEQLNAVDAKINQLSAIAITTQNLSAQTISGGQISAGTITADRLSVSSFITAHLVVNAMTLMQTLHLRFGTDTNWGVSYEEVFDLSDIIGKRVLTIYPE